MGWRGKGGDRGQMLDRRYRTFIPIGIEPTRGRDMEDGGGGARTYMRGR